MKLMINKNINDDKSFDLFNFLQFSIIMKNNEEQ